MLNKIHTLRIYISSHCYPSDSVTGFNANGYVVRPLLLLPSDNELKPPPGAADGAREKYSLFTQFRRQSGMLPVIALRISVAAISRSSVAEASL